MHWFPPLTMRKRHNETPSSELTAALDRVHRLEIACNQLRERLDDLEGRHASLSAQFRGRMGGRPPKQPTMLVPISAQHLFNQENR